MMTIYQTEKLAKYILQEIIKINLANNVISSDCNIDELKLRLTTEIEARLCVTPEGLTFDNLVSATVSQIDINKYINN